MTRHVIRKSASALVASVALFAALATAHAQDSTTGAVRGQVLDKANGQGVVGATVVATSPALQGSQTAITDGTGTYVITNLPPGTYLLAVYYADAQFQRKDVIISIGKAVKVNIPIDTQAKGGEVINIQGTAPLIDQELTKTGVTINKDYTDNVPTGRTFGAVLGAAAGSQGDLYGISFGGSTSAENTYIVEGLNTTDPGFGLLSTNLPNEFIYETEVITGGYNAEYGRSTGAVINVVTKSGSNEFHGSVFSYWTPGALVATQKDIPTAGSSIFRSDDLANRFDVGAEVGGPIVKDKVWFHVGFNPSFNTTTVNRDIKTQVDDNGDGVPDTDANGFTILRKIDDPAAHRSYDDSTAQYYYTAKINGAVNPNHQGQVSFLGSQRSHQDIFSVTGEPSATQLDIDEGIIDVSGKWTSKFNDNKTQVDVVAGLHSDDINQSPHIAAGAGSQVRYETARPLTDFMSQEGMVPGACDDGAANDPYPMIENCPAQLYRTGGVGFLEDDNAKRLVGIASVTQRVNAAGHHTFKAGVEVEDQNYDSARQYTGDGWYRQRSSGLWTIRTFQTVVKNGPLQCGPDINGDGTPDATCATVDGNLTSNTHTRNLGAYLQDSWAIRPNLTLNAGVRYEQQTLFTADALHGTISNVTGEPIPDVAFKLGNMIAPRVGVIYDWTNEGKSKAFAHWGRFYESIPMDINVRAYGGEIIAIDYYLPTACDLDNPVGSCDSNQLIFPLTFGDSDVLHDPGIKAQYMDEVVAGTEYEVLPDLKVGATYVHRNLGRAIEDVSTDGATTYVVVNPGEVHQGAIDNLRSEAMSEAAAGNQGRADFLNYEADNLQGNSLFDKPKRTYDAVEIKANKRFSNNFFVLASYTYSRLRGNYPGLFSPETGQLDPNLTSMYDLPELMANRYGALKADRPNNFKLDGYYVLPVAQHKGAATFGLSARATSGIANTPLGGNFAYGRQESYILPRGAAGRTPLATRFDAHIAYGHQLSKLMKLEAFADIFNVFNQQTQLAMDEEYTFDNVNPIIGGTDADLAHAKALAGSGDSTQTLIEKQPNYGNLSARQAPLSIRFGVRLTF